MEISITMSEFYKKYQAEKLSIIDVREVYEFVSGHVPTAQNLPLSSLEAGYKQTQPAGEILCHLPIWRTFCGCVSVFKCARI